MTKIRIELDDAAFYCEPEDAAEVRAMYGGLLPLERQRLRRFVSRGLPLTALSGAGDDQRRAHTPVRCR